MRAIALPVSACIYLGVQHPNFVPTAIPTVAAKEKSVAHTVAPGIYLRWNRNSPAIRDAASGELIIWDAAAEPRVFLLSSDELHHGSALYLDSTEDMRPRLFVLGKGSGFSEIPISIGEAAR